jgi:hypothetical protein
VPSASKRQVPPLRMPRTLAWAFFILECASCRPQVVVARPASLRTPLVVVSRLHDDEFFVPELIDEAVFVGDAARPVAGQVM